MSGCCGRNFRHACFKTGLAFKIPIRVVQMHPNAPSQKNMRGHSETQLCSQATLQNVLNNLLWPPPKGIVYPKREDTEKGFCVPTARIMRRFSMLETCWKAKHFDVAICNIADLPHGTLLSPTWPWGCWSNRSIPCACAATIRLPAVLGKTWNSFPSCGKLLGTVDDSAEGCSTFHRRL